MEKQHAEEVDASPAAEGDITHSADDVGAQPVLATQAGSSALGTLRMRLIAFAVLVIAGLGWVAIGTVNARNVYFNAFVDEGRYNGIGRFTRETVMSVWATMWDRTPDFGSVELTRLILFGSAAAFVVAAVAVIYLVLVPSSQTWSDDLAASDGTDRTPGD